jgi:hypothetical protein
LNSIGLKGAYAGYKKGNARVGFKGGFVYPMMSRLFIMQFLIDSQKRN